MTENKSIVSNKDLVELGFRPYTADRIIRQARAILVKQGFEFYSAKRIMVVPKSTVEEILGTKL